MEYQALPPRIDNESERAFSTANQNGHGNTNTIGNASSENTILRDEFSELQGRIGNAGEIFLVNEPWNRS